MLQHGCLLDHIMSMVKRPIVVTLAVTAAVANDDLWLLLLLLLVLLPLHHLFAGDWLLLRS